MVVLCVYSSAALEVAEVQQLSENLHLSFVMSKIFKRLQPFFRVISYLLRDLSARLFKFGQLKILKSFKGPKLKK